MRYPLLVLVHALVFSARTVIKDDMYQIQGVIVDDGIDRAVSFRRKRQASVQPTLASESSVLNNTRFTRHISGYPLQPLQQQQQAIVQQLQQLQQKQQGLHSTAPPQQQRKLPVNGVAATTLQQSGLLSQLPPKPEAPAGSKRTDYKKKKSTEYAYGPRMPLPLDTCFHNPTGYVCCNMDLNDLMVDTWTMLEQRPKFQPCNLNVIADQMQLQAQRRFNTSFESIVAHEDFAQKINFRGNMVCKIEMGKKFIITYATATDAYNHDLAGLRREKRETNEEFSWSAGIAESWHSIHSSLI